MRIASKTTGKVRHATSKVRSASSLASSKASLKASMRRRVQVTTAQPARVGVALAAAGNQVGKMLCRSMPGVQLPSVKDGKCERRTLSLTS